MPQLVAAIESKDIYLSFKFIMLMFKIRAFDDDKSVRRSCVRFGMLFTRENHLHDHIISLKR